MPRRADHETSNQFVVTKSTVFHRATIYGAIVSAFAAFALPPAATLSTRLALSLGAVVGGLLLFHFAVLVFVVVVMIPRVRHGSFWSYEIDSYMRSVIGTKWDHGGEEPSDG